MLSTLRAALVESAHIRRDQLKWRRPMVTAVVTAALTGACVAGGHLELAVPVSVGAWFAGVADTGEVIGDHWRSMLWTTVWISVGAAFGGLASELGLMELLVVAAMSMACGFAGALGPRGALNGLLALVVYAVFAGAPATELGAVQNALFVFLGGSIQIAVAIAPTAVRRPRALMRTRPRAPGVLVRLREHSATDDAFLRHGARLVVAMVVATAIADGIGWPHEYWIPMTVAWMARPDRSGTATRVVERILGTIAGILVAALVIDGLGQGMRSIVVIVGLGVFVSLAFLQANYPIAVVGLTTTVIALFVFLGDPVASTAPYRVAATLLAGVITFLASFLWPVSSTGSAGTDSRSIVPGLPGTPRS